MSSLKQQQGLSMIGWLCLIVLFGFSVLVVSKLGPHYIDNRYVVSALKTLADNPDLSRMAPGEIRSSLSKIFTVNNIRGKATESVKVVKNSNATQVTIAYEERINLIYNIDVVLVFNHLLDSRSPGDCCKVPDKVTQ